MVASCLQKIELWYPSFGLQVLIVISVVLYSDCCKLMKNCRDSAFSNSGLEAGLPASLSAADVGKMWCTAEKEIYATCLLQESIPTIAIPFGIPSIHSTRSLRSLRAAARSTSSELFHQAHPFVAAAGKTSLMQRIEQLPRLSFKQQWVGSRAASQPFSWRCWQNVMHCRKEIYATCLLQESIPTITIPFGIPSIHSTRSLRSLRAAARSTSSELFHQAHPFVAPAGKTSLMQRIEQLPRLSF